MHACNRVPQRPSKRWPSGNAGLPHNEPERIIWRAAAADAAEHAQGQSADEGTGQAHRGKPATPAAAVQISAFFLF